MKFRASAPLLALLAMTTATSVAFAQNGSATPAGTLMVGDKAPPMKVAKWVKGQPLEGFAPGKVYVVEFWATWCGPCRTSIPHLTELQKTYGDKVTFNGIAVWQRESADKYLASVTDFVKTMGPKMAYNVAADTSPSNGAMAKGWMTAAGQNGIPTAFVVGKDSRIAWIGHPMDPEFPKTLDSLLDGTFDAVAAKATAQRKAEAAGAMQKAMATVTAAYKKGDDATADAAMKSLVAGYPDTAGMVLNIRFNRALEKGNETGAHTVLREGWSAADLDAEDLNNFAWALVTDKRIKNRDYPLAIAIATRGVELSEEKNAPVIDTLAYALFYGGKVDEAIAWEQKAVDLTGGKDQAMVDALTQYKKAKG